MRGRWAQQTPDKANAPLAAGDLLSISRANGAIEPVRPMAGYGYGYGYRGRSCFASGR
jgi:hypothetical protein